MSVHANPTTPQFKDNAHKALGDPQLQEAMGKLRVGFTASRALAISKLPEFEALRDSARDIKNHT
ncbi:MAG: (Fe-S)-binding protein, partial [Rhodoblastus sp.]